MYSNGKKMRNTHFSVDDLTPRIDPLLVQYHCHQGCTAAPLPAPLPAPTSADINVHAAGTPGTMSHVDAPEIMGTPGARAPVPLALHNYRKPAMVVSITDGIFATSLLVFHGLTIMIQEIPDEQSPEDNWLLPRIPMTPGELTITGYMEVIAWIGIFGVNFTQLLVAVGLFNGCDKNNSIVPKYPAPLTGSAQLSVRLSTSFTAATEALKAFESTRVYIKTTIFIITILFTKLCILYFMHRMEMYAVGTVIFTSIETIFHLVALVIVFKFFQEIKTNYPTITDIYLMPTEDSSPKVNPVADAVWF